MFKTIKIRLVAVCAAIVLSALVATGALLVHLVGNDTRQSVNESIGTTTQNHADLIAQWALERRNNTSAISAAVEAQDPAPFLKAVIRSGGLEESYFVTADNKPVFLVPRPASYSGRDRPWFKQAEAAGRPVITPAYADYTTNRMMITFAEPLYETVDGMRRLRAVMASDASLDKLSKSVGAIHPREDSFAVLLEADGRIIAFRDDKFVLKPVRDLLETVDFDKVQAATKLSEGTGFTINGARKLMWARPVADTPWTLVMVIDEGQAMAPVTHLTWIIVASAVACAVVGMLLLAFVITRQLRPLDMVRDALQDIASGEGDLNKRLPAQGNDELAQIGAAFNQFVDKIGAVLRRTRDSADSVRTASQEIAMGNQDLSHRTEQQASSLEQTVAALDELTQTVQHNADNARQANQLASDARDVATQGGDVVAKVVQTMRSISESSSKITEIIGVIDSIAFQTNILALNAAVEAARAGEQGRGFAVVASEVRTLAQRSATAAQEIKALISTSVQQVDVAGDLVNDAGRTMEQIVTGVRRVSDMVSEISVASAEQSRGLVEVNGAMGLMDQATQQNAALVEQATAAAQSLQQQSAMLSELVGGFQLD